MKKYMLVALLSLMINTSCLIASENINSLNRRLQLLIGFGSREQVEKLLDSGADVNYANSYGWTALMYAAESGSKEKIELMLENGANVNAATNDGWTVLTWAARLGSKEIVELMLEKRANVNAATNDGWTALIWAVYSGSKETVKLLLKNGADVSVANIHGRTAIYYADNSEIEELLMNYKAFKFAKIDKNFESEPKPEDYFQNAELLAQTNGELGHTLDEYKKITDAFERDYFVYWHNKAQAAYGPFVFENNPAKLRALLTQEIDEKAEGLPLVIARSFNSREGFLYALNQLKSGATTQELGRLQKIFETERAFEAGRVKIEEDMNKRYREAMQLDDTVIKIQRAYRKHKQLQSSKQQNLSDKDLSIDAIRAAAKKKSKCKCCC